MSFAMFLLPLLVFFGGATGQIYLANYTTANTPSSFTTICAQVLNQVVECSTSLGGVGFSNDFYSQAFLTSVCTSTCTSALQNYLRKAEAACAGLYVDGGNGYQYLAAYHAELVWERYETLCLANSAGQLCNPLLASAAGVNPQNQASTAKPQPSFLCNTCVLSALQTSLELPLASNSEVASSFSSITSSCKVSGLTITKPASTAWVKPATATRTASSPTSTACVGKTYAIKSGDTCNSVAASQGISTVNLLSANNLQAFCVNFPTSGSLCIPTAYTCTTYVIKTGDTCTTIAQGINGATWTQIVSWNPFFGTYCQNAAQYVGYVACASNPGGSWVNPYPSSSTVSTSTNTIFTLAMTAIPNALSTAIVANATSTTSSLVSGSAPPGPVASGTRLDCDLLFQAPILTNFSSGATSLSCAAAAAAYNISVTNLVTWNPILGSASTCTLTSGVQYCGQLTSQMAPSTTKYCTQYALAPPGWACSNFTANYGIEQDCFGAWNPDVGKACNNWQTGVEYCVAVEHFQQPGIVSTCNKLVMANDTDWLDLPCQIIETQFGLSHARFVAWNPSVLNNCSGIVHHYDYCVSIPGYHPTYTTTTPVSTWINTWSWMTALPTTSSRVTQSAGTMKSTGTSKSSSTTKTSSTAKTSSKAKSSSTTKS